ncbi:DinB family protein [Paenibacillus xylanexedens]|uniref:DinB family protein n=1 Tax=Paenibacillus xylanexedens TaxID=528191 RepID=UPI001F21B870|nr:DinB family protein [Paenibacillus xylanexedens]MCF7755036.1 DinB family protein [Paenibacillus xylanexedens]
MSYKTILIDQLNACYHDKSWFIPLHDILTDLNAAEAAYVKNEGEHSIWAIVNHLIFWNEKWLERYIAEQVDGQNSVNNEDTFDIDTSNLNDVEWSMTLHRLKTVFSDWNKALEDSEEHKLTREIPAYFNAPWWGVVSNLCIHNAYHIGQIMLLKKSMKHT